MPVKFCVNLPVRFLKSRRGAEPLQPILAALHVRVLRQRPAETGDRLFLPPERFVGGVKAAEDPLPIEVGTRFFLGTNGLRLEFERRRLLRLSPTSCPSASPLGLIC